MSAHVFDTTIVRLTVEPISYAEAAERIAAGKPTYWLKQWSHTVPSGSTANYAHIGTNTPVRTTAWKTLAFPKLPVEGLMSAPQKGEFGWWFGKPVSFAEQVKGTAKWWRDLGRNDGSSKRPLQATLEQYRQLYAGGDHEYDWVTEPSATLEYACSWVFGRGLNFDVPYVEVAGYPVVEVTNADNPALKDLLAFAIEQGLEPQVRRAPKRLVLED